MRISILTNEYPPHIYGGAGVHVEYLTRELALQQGGAHEVRVHCFGDQRDVAGNLRVRGFDDAGAPPAREERHQRLFGALQRNLAMAGAAVPTDIAHCHTWYTHWAGCLIKQLTGAKLVLTTHSLEPHRPWKYEQLGTAYHVSSWIERTAYQNADAVIAVSPSMRDDVHALYNVPLERIAIIPNGIDPSEYHPTYDTELLRKYGIDPSEPFVLFVGRITRQKGIIHLVNAIAGLSPGIQVVLAAGAPDTVEIEREMAGKVQAAREASSRNLVWISEMLPRNEIITLYSHAAVFACPSVYEPFGIINLEAMACETAVVATDVGGIPTVVTDGETGILVPLELSDTADAQPRDPAAFAHALAQAINRLMADPDRRRAYGLAGRARVLERFSWRAIAAQTLALYERLSQSR